MNKAYYVFITLSIALMGLLSGCNLNTKPTPNAAATQMAMNLIASTPLAITAMPVFTNTPLPTATLDPALIPTATPTPMPTTYTLQVGEFPYCIARRFNVDPTELLSLNHLSATAGAIYKAGMTLSIPQSGKPFPPPRALNTHPASFTVPSAQWTIYKVACYFGDVDPQIIMQMNGLTSPTLTAGQVLQIP